MFHPFSSSFCSTPHTYSPSPLSTFHTPSHFTIQPRSGTGGKGCHGLLHLAQIALLAGMFAATLLQFLGALCVRAYARALAAQDEPAIVLEAVGMSEVEVQPVVKNVV